MSLFKVVSECLVEIVPAADLCRKAVRGLAEVSVTTVPEGYEVDASAHGLKEPEASTKQGYAWTESHMTKCDQRFIRSKQCGVGRGSQRLWGKGHCVQQIVKCQAALADLSRERTSGAAHAPPGRSKGISHPLNTLSISSGSSNSSSPAWLLLLVPALARGTKGDAILFSLCFLSFFLSVPMG